jgi:peptide/nickel transport system permease protein
MTSTPPPTPTPTPAPTPPSTPSSPAAGAGKIAGKKDLPSSPLRLALASFFRHKPAMIGLVALGLLYFLAVFGGFVAPYHYDNQQRELVFASPTPLRFSDEAGSSWRPFIYPVRQTMDENLNLTLEPDRSQRSYMRFFVTGDKYYLLGLIPMRVHLFGFDEIKPGSSADPYYTRFYLFGADQVGRCVFSRICQGAWISMTIGIIGASFVFCIGMLIGGVSGYCGGRVDMVLQRITEMVMLLPGFYLLLMLRYLFPTNMSSIAVYFTVISIMALVGWPGFSRVIRGLVLAIRNQPYVEASRAIGSGHLRTIVGHVLPNTLSYAIVAVSLAIPGYILGESALSLLGLGISDPTPSWGNLLSRAMDLTVLNKHPWMLWPGAFIFLAVMGFNLVGDGLRDAFDPRQRRL